MNAYNIKDLGNVMFDNLKDIPVTYTINQLTVLSKFFVLHGAVMHSSSCVRDHKSGNKLRVLYAIERAISLLCGLCNSTLYSRYKY